MIYLLIVSLIWAFSFGLIKGTLTDLNPIFVSWVRLLLPFILFLPFLRLKGITKKLAIKLILIGMVQYGFMYIAYNWSFQFLKAYEVALFTIFTPLYVTLFNNYIHKSYSKLILLTTLLAIIGTGIVVQSDLIQNNFLLGFIIVQISNICFAVGQIYYRDVMAQIKTVKDHQIFGLLYFGAALITGLSTLLFTNWQSIAVTSKQVFALLYLGIIASGIAFFLWNYGARKVDIGALAIFNNLKIPLSIAVSLIVFQEKTNIINLLVGGSIVIAALFINEWGLGHNKQLQKTTTAPE
jgi:drug/metabolite transporter (DMT)-like permease